MPSTKKLAKGNDMANNSFDWLIEKIKEARTLADELASKQGLDIQITMTVKPANQVAYTIDGEVISLGYH